MRAPLHRASDWIYILLADSQRSPVSVMFDERFGSPVRIRTYDPVVNSPEISGLFSAAMCYRRLPLRMRNPVRERKADAPAGRISCVFLCIFLLLQREMRG